MRNMRNFFLIIGAIGVVATLFNPAAVLAVDGAAQTESFIKSIITTLVGISGAVAVVFMVVGGFKYITSSGHPEKLDSAKRTLLFSGVGLVVVIAAYAIVDVVAGMAKSSFGG
jgi:hypothetical protein